MKLTLTSFRVLNFRNIDDSGPIEVERVTAFVGRNEAGKSALLRGLHKFNPATKEPYEPQREFPRDRYTAEFRNNGAGIPVCEAEFALSTEFRAELKAAIGAEPPSKVACIRFYDGALKLNYDTSVSDSPVSGTELGKALEAFSAAVRRVAAPTADQESTVQELRATLVTWATQQKDAVKNRADLKNPAGIALLKKVRDEANGKSSPLVADHVEALVASIESLLASAATQPISEKVDAAITAALPVFIYFENYGILDSAVYLPRLLEDISRTPNDPRVRTITAMFKHVGLTAQEISTLGKESAEEARRQNQAVTGDMIRQDQANKELRAIKLSSASNAITKQFNEWYGQRRHNIRYQADGDYFRIWVSDDKRPGVEIELESRSKGFQWFFSFYLVFLVESKEGHQDAILLLDEPGLDLHPTAQQELVNFFERLSEDNPLIYTTHSPFLIDGDHIHRVRPVSEDATGHSHVSTADTWPHDRETIFPLQAAAGYAMVKGLFQHKKNVLVEGMADYLYLHSLNLQCRKLGKTALPDDIYITPCGGTKYMGYIASLFLGQEVRPVILLDSDKAGRDRYAALLKELYSGHETALLLLSEVTGKPDCEVEDLVGEAAILPQLSDLVGKSITIKPAERTAGALPDQIVAAAARLSLTLPDGWKAEIARRLAFAWSTTDPKAFPEDLADRAAELFKALNKRFAATL